MDFKKLISQLDQLHEADVKHKGTYGTSYQGDDDEDDDKKTAPASTEKRGRGRPKKAGGAADTSAKYSGAKDLQSMMVGNIPKDSKELKKLPKIKNTLKDWIESIDEQMMLAEADQVTMEPAKQNTQVIKQGNKTLGTVSNPQLAAQIKQSIGKGEMSLAGSQLGEEDEGKPGKNFAKIAKSAGKHYGSKEAGERVAGAVRAKLMKQGKIKEAALPTHDGDAGAGLGAGRSNYALEGMAKGKKPDFVDLDKDGDKKESMKKAASDAKKGKKKVAEGMDQRLEAAYQKVERMVYVVKHTVAITMRIWKKHVAIMMAIWQA
jgi:hypothetical protein